MERTFSPMIRQYSAIDGLQQAYTLVYAMEVEGTQGCRLTLCQIGSRQQIVSQHVAAAPEFCYRLLRYLCENGVQPELWTAPAFAAAKSCWHSCGRVSVMMPWCFAAS